MELLLLFVIVLFLLPLVSLTGWGLKLLEKLLGVFGEGIGNCLGCLLKIIAGIVLLNLLLAMCAGV